MSTFIVLSGSRVNIESITSYRRTDSGSVIFLCDASDVFVNETPQAIDALIEEARKKEAERKREEKEAEYETVLGWAKKLYEGLSHVEPPAIVGTWPGTIIAQPGDPSDTEPPQEAK